MAIMKEDFIRCQCGNADFEEKIIVSIRHGVYHRATNTSEPIPSAYIEGKEVVYICTRCEQFFNI